MNSVCIEGFADAELCKDWDSFVEVHPEGTIFQTSHYFRIFEKQNAFKPVAVLVKDGAQNVTGVLSGIIQYQLPSPFKNRTSRCIVIGGPLVLNNDAGLMKIILESFDKLISNKVIYTQFRNLFDMHSGISSFAEFNYTFTDHLNILVDLTRPEEILWKEIHKQKRYEIRRAGREGLSFKPITTTDELESSYNLLSKIYKRIKLPIFPFQVFQNAFNSLFPKEMAAFWGAYLEGKLVGTMYTLCYKGRIYDYFAGSDSIHYNKFPNSLIPWEVMRWGKSSNMTLFDWGGAGKPGIPYGVRDYKEKFGGKLVSFGRFEKIHKPVLFQVAKSAFTLFRHLK
jgi:serine/alanine adding enzyme